MLQRQQNYCLEKDFYIRSTNAEVTTLTAYKGTSLLPLYGNATRKVIIEIIDLAPIKFY